MCDGESSTSVGALVDDHTPDINVECHNAPAKNNQCHKSTKVIRILKSTTFNITLSAHAIHVSTTTQTHWSHRDMQQVLHMMCVDIYIMVPAKVWRCIGN